MAPVSSVTFDIHLDDQDLHVALERDVRAGLAATPKSIPPTWFYDEAGSQIFDEITRLPEYYPTRAERALLTRHSGEIAHVSGADTLVELGAGSCGKTRLLLDAFAAEGSLRRYVPFDVSAAFLEDAATAIADEYPGLQVHAVVGDFRRHLGAIPATGRRVVAFLGGTIGNLVPTQRARFFRALGTTMSPDDRFLVGSDLVKERRRIVAAYDDAAGVTARFNRNVLFVLNRELDADFVPDLFEHVVRWDEDERWIEMRLRSRTDHDVALRRLQMSVRFAAGEEMLTEISAKFTPEGIAAELERAGFTPERQWGASAGEFLLTLARPRP